MIALRSDVERPSKPERPLAFTVFRHPVNKYAFFQIIQNVSSDPPTTPDSEKTYGICYTVALEACKIIACNQAGYLSTSSDASDDSARVADPPDDDLVLTERLYFYHVDQDDPNYSVCIDFDNWEFPHQNIPDSWKNTPNATNVAYHDNWSAQSTMIRWRDRLCRVSHWNSGRTTAHIVPEAHATWMIRNNMLQYAFVRNAIFWNDSRNLFALRSDLHVPQYDAGTYVVVPIAGRMCVYFINDGKEAEYLYHLQEFDTTDLSHEYLYARFAWAVIKCAYVVLMNSPDDIRASFKILSGSEQGEDKEESQPGPSSKRCRVDEPESSGKRKGKGTKSKKGTRKKKGTKKKGTKKDQARLDAQELHDDLEIAKKTAPFFVTPDGVADPYDYEHMTWYPGCRSIERLKDNYIKTHPSVCAHTVGSSDVDDNSDFLD